MSILAERSKLSQMTNMERETFVAAKAEKVEMKLNTDSAVASGLLIQRLTELYEDPVEASVRETVSNAIDAVTKSHSGERPEVNIYPPTSLNPVLTIKDNGVGMTYEDLKEIYSKYGASTKADDLDQIGAYGLGAKAPLAYGTEFTVTSVKDNQKTTIIVAREEMTNYIKIVDSVFTDEASGTTVSIPVSTSDIDRFSENVDKYKNIPIDKDIDLYINDKLITNDSYKQISDEVLIYDGKEKVYARAWVNEKSIVNLLNNLISRDSISSSVKYVIGGWAYDPPQRRSYYRSSGSIVVELKAGIVGFNSSRDAILDNDRYEALDKLVVDYVSSSKFVDDLIVKINELDLETFKDIVSKIMAHNRRHIEIEDGKIVIPRTSSYVSSYIKRSFKLEDFVHQETGFTFNKVLENIPSTNKTTVVISEEKERYAKTPRNSIMNNYMKHSMFSTKNVSKINEKIDEIFNGEEESHSLSNLMVNLSLLVFNKEAGHDTKVTFITDVKDEKELKSLKSSRKAIVRLRNNFKELPEYQSILIYTEHKKEEIDKMIAGVMDDADIEVSEVKEIMDKIKKSRAKRRVEKKVEVNELSTAFRYFDPKSYTFNNSTIKDIDKTKKNLIVVTKGRITLKRADMMLSWFCNENNYSDEEARLYISLGMHTASDVKLLTDAAIVMRDPDSERAGLSKAYLTKIDKNRVKLNAVRNNSIKSEGEVLIRLLSGLTGRRPGALSNQIRRNLDRAYEIAKIAEFDLPDYPEDKIEVIESYSEEIFNDMGYYSDWQLHSSAIKHLFTLIDKSKYELLQYLVSMGDCKTLRIKENEEYSVSFGHSYEFCHEADIKDSYKSNSISAPHAKLIKANTEANLEYAKTFVQALQKVDI